MRGPPAAVLFTSAAYLVFLPVALVLAYRAPRGVRWAVLLALSVVFYGWWNPLYLAPLALSAATDYVAGRRMARLETRRARRPWLVLSLAVNLGLLGAFKYAAFAADSVAALTGGAVTPPVLDVVLPVGISFYTFQTLAYSIDVYRGRIAAEAHAGRFGLYVLFFPQLVAGPIERAQALLPQLAAETRWDTRRAASALLLILWGLVKKVVIADRLGLYVDAVYADPHAVGSLDLLLASYAFAFQIYGDFSGYSDIAVGSARLLGVDLMENFHRPYASRSVAEFWRRWHVSLSTWFRDYLYVPLGGNRRGEGRTAANLFAVFLVSGLWHGAAWTFVAWGALHGALVVTGRWTAAPRDRLWQHLGARLGGWTARLRGWTGLAVTFHLVVAAWVLFRADSLRAALGILRRIADPAAWAAPGASPGFGVVRIAFATLLVGALLAVEAQAGRASVDAWAMARPVRRRVFVVACLVALAVLGLYRETSFIYFQF